MMTAAVKQILDEFDHLADAEKRELAAEVLRRAVRFDYPPLTNDELVGIADQRFLDLDREEQSA